MSLYRACHNLRRCIRLVSFACVSAICITLNAYAADNSPAKDADSLVVVVSIDSNIEILKKNDVIDIYMGRFDTFPNGDDAKPLDFPDGSTEKQTFYEKLVGKDERKIKAYWSRLLFSGRAQPPATIDSTSDIKSLITDSNTIAYIPMSDVTSEMKIVYKL